MNNSGIYYILNKVNRHFYVGGSDNLSKRWIRHQSDLNRNKHHNIRLQRAWNKYGKDHFIFKRVIYCNVFNIDFYEQRFLDKFVGMEDCYNIAKYTDSGMRNRHHSQETKLKISKNNGCPSGKNHPMWGKHPSIHTRLKQRLIKLGQSNNRSKLTDEQVLHIKLKIKAGVLNKIIAQEFNVDATTISDIKTGRTWNHL